MPIRTALSMRYIYSPSYRSFPIVRLIHSAPFKFHSSRCPFTLSLSINSSSHVSHISRSDNDSASSPQLVQILIRFDSQHPSIVQFGSAFTQIKHRIIILSILQCENKISERFCKLPALHLHSFRMIANNNILVIYHARNLLRKLPHIPCHLATLLFLLQFLSDVRTERNYSIRVWYLAKSLLE